MGDFDLTLSWAVAVEIPQQRPITLCELGQMYLYHLGIIEMQTPFYDRPNGYYHYPPSVFSIQLRQRLILLSQGKIDLTPCNHLGEPTESFNQYMAMRHPAGRMILYITPSHIEAVLIEPTRF